MWGGRLRVPGISFTVYPGRQTIFFLFFAGAFGNTPRLKAGEGVSSEKFLQPNAFERISSEKFLQPNAFERIYSEKFLQPNAFERISSEKFLQKRVVGENSSRKRLQKKAVGENSSRKRLQKKAVGENSSRKCLQLMLVGRVVYYITGLHSKFHRNDTLLQSHQAPPDELLSGDDECQNPVTTTYISRRTKILLLPIVLLYGHPLWGAFFYSIGRMRLRPNEDHPHAHAPRVPGKLPCPRLGAFLPLMEEKEAKEDQGAKGRQPNLSGTPNDRFGIISN